MKGQTMKSRLSAPAFLLLLAGMAPAGWADPVLSGNAVWTWMKGTNIINQLGTYGAQGAPDPANTPGARENATAWTDGAGGLWVFGGKGCPASGSQ
jgi:hypothetical protein